MEQAKTAGKVRLSRRLQMVASFVEPCRQAADIGTDHGYVPIWLVKNGISFSALAMDVKSGPLKKAKQHIRLYGVEDRVRTRLSDGLDKLGPGEADAVIMAGMGGELMVHILEQGAHMWESVCQWILSPQSELDRVRYFLEQNKFVILDEEMVKDEGKYYTVIKAARGDMSYNRQIWYLYGRCLLEKRHPVLREYLEREAARIREILAGLDQKRSEGETKGMRRARAGLLEELSLIKEAQDEMQ